MKRLGLLVLCLFGSVFGAEMRGFLTPEEIALFYKQGYLLKPKILDPVEVAQVKEQLSEVIDRALDQIQQSADPVFSEEEQIMYIDGARVVFKRRPDQSVAIARINGCSGMQPELIETVRSDKMVQTFFELLGTSEIEHLISQIHPKLPGDSIAFPKHRDIQFRKSFDPDWQDVLGNGSYGICFISIDPMTPENGGLWVDRNNYPEPQGLEEDLVWIYAEPGDLLFMHPYLYHGSGPNISANSRTALLTGFCAFGANHKAYPGAHVNAHLTLDEDNQITVAPSPWNPDASTAPVSGH